MYAVRRLVTRSGRLVCLTLSLGSVSVTDLCSENNFTKILPEHQDTKLLVQQISRLSIKESKRLLIPSFGLDDGD